MSFKTCSAPQVVSGNSFKKSFKAGPSLERVSANSFKKSFKSGPSLERQANSKKLETGKVFRQPSAKAQDERQPSLSNRRSFKVSRSLRKIAAEAVAAQDSHNSPAALVGAFSFKTNYRKSLAVAEAMSPSRPTTSPTHTVITVVSGDVGDVVEGLAPVTTERRPPGTPPQLEGEWRVKKAGGGDNDAAAPTLLAGGAYSAIAHLRRHSDCSNPADPVNVNANRRPSSVQQIMQGLLGAGSEIMNTKLFTDEGVGSAKNQKQRAEPSKRASCPCRLEDKWPEWWWSY